MRIIIYLLFIGLLAGCGRAAVESPTAPGSPVAQMTAATEPPATATAEPSATTAPPATATALPTTTAVPTNTTTPPATATGDPATAAATAAATTARATPAATVSGTAVPSPPPAGNVEAPPYEASACSDRYPCNDDRAGWEARIRVPAGFKVSYYGRINGQPTSITFGPDGQLYIATMAGTIFRMNSGGVAAAYVSGFLVPTGIAFQPGTDRLYVASRITSHDIDGESKISIVQGGAVSTIITGLPCCYTSYHAANGIAFGPDGNGYVGVGGRADHGEILVGPNAGEQDQLHPYEAAILRFSPDGSSVERYARGFRNPYDIAWDANGQLWATDNTPDFHPPERLHRVVPGGEHGYPWYDCDVCFSPPPGVTVIPPAVTFTPRSSPTGITAYLASQFPGYYNSLFVTLWSAFPGAQKVMHVGAGGGAPRNFATGFAAPIDVTVGPDGSLFVADWATGIVFKISYVG